ncbi:coiled-coil domain-containing protein [Actinocorallia populi]|uniref:hypothetical protein n=1 Tax=Actinocorallia populi TaxID=2079200 RepID=UPI000D090EF6|nr:hypothetical protein [Actinocorallia populi]
MSDSSRTELRAALAAVIEEARSVDLTDDTAALVFVTGLQRALEDLPELFGLAGTLIEAAMLGSTARERLAGRIAELDRLRAELGEEQQTLRRLQPVLAELKAAAAERERVAQELAELQRLRSLAEELPALREQRLLLERRRAELESAEAAEAALASAADELVRSSDARLALLAPLAREAVEHADRADRELAAAKARLLEEQVRSKTLTAELAALTADFEALREQSERRIPFLQRYREADAELRDGLARGAPDGRTGLDQARTALAEVEERLQEIDGLLRSALHAHDKSYAELRAETGLL